MRDLVSGGFFAGAQYIEQTRKFIRERMTTPGKHEVSKRRLFRRHLALRLSKLTSFKL